MQRARTAHLPLTSAAVRSTFLDYFCVDKGHRHVRSSPVLPFGDPSLAFVNAGMNQFKGVLLGTALAPSARVANAQKCVRVGGRHNDLSLVGRDGSHHTFFEMLGNWSFGDYFKAEACVMAWELLTNGYRLSPASLHVTYFGGDAALGLEPDYETRDIWRQIGVPEERLQPGGATDNFWEMGETGPCGGCTEIHYGPQGTPADSLLELWNLVFIEYKREVDGTLSKLGRCHVDTGMGFERLLAVLQGHTSNYDTDLFTPLFHAIQRATGCPTYGRQYGPTAALDTAYRVLADHARMVTVCLADGFFPDQEGKLRGIVRKALAVSRDAFRQGDNDYALLVDLASVVADTLSPAYPELARNLPRVHHIIRHEAELLRSLRKHTLGEWEEQCRTEPQLAALSIAECPNLLPAYRKLRGSGESLQGQLPPSLALSACETHGVPLHLAGELAAALGLQVDIDAVEALSARAKQEARKDMFGLDQAAPGSLSAEVVQELSAEGVLTTDDSAKHQYRASFQPEPTFPDQPATVQALIVDGDVLHFASPELLTVPDCSIGVILDRTNLYSEAGGQAADHGTITVEGVTLQVVNVTSCAGYVIHWVRCAITPTIGVRVHDQCVVSIDAARRRAMMNNHTATHILNAALRQVLTVTEQKSSRVSASKLSFDFSVYRENLTNQDLRRIEKTAQDVIRHGVPVRRKSIGSSEIGSLDPLTVVPGETYLHRSVTVIEIPSGYFLSREPCCGTHAVCTSHLQDLVITSYKSLSSCVKSLQAVTGAQAGQARTNANIFTKQLAGLSKRVKQVLQLDPRDETQVEACDSELIGFARSMRDCDLLSHSVEQDLAETVNALRTRLKYSARGSLRSLMETEMKEVVAGNSLPYLVHYLQCSSSLDSVPLQKAQRFCPNLPSLLLARSQGLVKARCVVPQELVREGCSAQLWLDAVLREVGAEGGPPRGQSPDLVCNMKAKKLSDQQLEAALKGARDFAASRFS